MKYCKRCLYPENHPLGIIFDEYGICSGCRIHEEKDMLPWAERFEKLREICDQFKSRDRTIHDCIVPVSGGRDSYFIVHLVKNVLKMTPLLVSYNKHYNTITGIRNLAYLRTQLGCDFIQCTVNPEKVKRITRETIKSKGSIYWHCLAGQTAFPVQTAVKFKIPLIIWGVHQGIDQVGMFSHTDEVEMTRKYRKEHDLMGLEARDLLSMDNELKDDDLMQYFYPHDKELEMIGVRGIYLNNYVRWDSKKQHEEMIDRYGYETLCQQRTFDTYNDVDCFHYSGLHDYIKYLKYGYGKVTDHACREIRLKRMSREQAIKYVDDYKNNKPKDTSLFLKWLGMDAKKFWRYIDKHRDQLVWEKISSTVWKKIDDITNQINKSGTKEAELDLVDKCVFQLNPPREMATNKEEYTLLGRGWVD